LLAPQEDPANPSLLRIDPAAGKTIASRGIPIPPGPGLPFGTGVGGFDIYYALIWGTATALRFGVLIAMFASLFGTLVGAVSAFTGGILNRLVMRVTDAFLAFPAIAGLFLFRQLIIVPNIPALAVPTAAPARPSVLLELLAKWDIPPVMIALVFFSWMPYARIVNANVSVLKNEDYVLAARTVGATNRRIIFRHLLPNGIAPAIVMAARDVGVMVILEASFTFIGISNYLPWSVVLVASRDWIIGSAGNPFVYWWVFVPITLALALFTISWNMLGDGLNDALNPRVV